MATVTELTTYPKFQFEDLQIRIIEQDENEEVLAFIGEYSEPENFSGQGLIDANNLWRHSDCPSVSDRTPCKRPEGYVVAGTQQVGDKGYTLLIKREHLKLKDNEEFKAKIASFGFK